MKKVLTMILFVVMVLCVTLVACNKGPSMTGEGEFAYQPFSGTNSFSNEKVLPTDLPENLTEPTLQIHYYRKNSADYKKWGFWLWAKGGEGKLFNLNYQDDFGGIALYKLSEIGSGAQQKGIGVIPRLQSGWTKDGDADREIDFKQLTLQNNCYHVYVIQGDINVYTTLDDQLKQRVVDLKYGVNAEFTDEQNISIKTETPVKKVEILHGQVVLGGTDTELTALITYKFKKGSKAKIGDEYFARVVFEDGKTVTQNIAITNLFGTKSFDRAYYYDGELGALYEKEATTFRVWSPVSTKIVLNIYQKGDGAETPEKTEMTKGEKGVFETRLSGNMAGKYYTYTVYNSAYPGGREVVDPYAKSAGLNGVRGQIVDFSDTNPDGWDKIKPHAYDRKSLTVWETHVSDVTSSQTWKGTEKNRKKFLGMAESGTTYTKDGVTVKTGFDHIKELGVNAVQLVPIFDQANDESVMKFNWGYNPLNYNVLEGSYSSDPTDGYVRIREFKQLVKAYNEAGINIIMDVVYNHVAAASGSNFDVLMPGYYFRYTKTGEFSNGSGCGNETASDHSMFRKFMIDSVCFWAKEYKLGGFRFDLMGVHDIDTMNELNAELKKINSSIVVYGEPWEGGTCALAQSKQADQSNGNLLTVGQFSDQFRDALIKGGMNDKKNLGWVTNIGAVDTNDLSRIVAGLKGQIYTGSLTISSPDKVVNYVTCHDNYTLYDRIVATGEYETISHADMIKKMAVLADAMVFTANGTSFMLAGDEFLRTKGGDSNSYESSYKVNELDYSLKIKHYDVFENFKKLIAFKQICKALQYDENQISLYKVSTINGGATIQITFTVDGKNYKIIHSNSAVKGKNYTADFAGYTLYLDTVGGGALSANTPLLPYQTIIAYK